MKAVTKEQITTLKENKHKEVFRSDLKNLAQVLFDVK